MGGASRNGSGTGSGAGNVSGNGNGNGNGNGGGSGGGLAYRGRGSVDDEEEAIPFVKDEKMLVERLRAMLLRFGNPASAKKMHGLYRDWGHGRVRLEQLRSVIQSHGDVFELTPRGWRLTDAAFQQAAAQISLEPLAPRAAPNGIEAELEAEAIDAVIALMRANGGGPYRHAMLHAMLPDHVAAKVTKNCLVSKILKRHPERFVFGQGGWMLASDGDSSVDLCGASSSGGCGGGGSASGENPDAEVNIASSMVSSLFSGASDTISAPSVFSHGGGAFSGRSFGLANSLATAYAAPVASSTSAAPSASTGMGVAKAPVVLFSKTHQAAIAAAVADESAIVAAAREVLSDGRPLALADVCARMPESMRGAAFQVLQSVFARRIDDFEAVAGGWRLLRPAAARSRAPQVNSGGFGTVSAALPATSEPLDAILQVLPAELGRFVVQVPRVREELVDVLVDVGAPPVARSSSLAGGVLVSPGLSVERWEVLHVLTRCAALRSGGAAGGAAGVGSGGGDHSGGGDGLRIGGSGDGADGSEQQLSAAGRDLVRGGAFFIGRTLHRVYVVRGASDGQADGLTIRVGRVVQPAPFASAFGAALLEAAEAGRAVVVSGRAGAGKTTALRAAARQLADRLPAGAVLAVDPSGELGGGGPETAARALGGARRLVGGCPSASLLFGHRPRALVADVAAAAAPEVEAACLALARAGVAVVLTSSAPTASEAAARAAAAGFGDAPLVLHCRGDGAFTATLHRPPRDRE